MDPVEQFLSSLDAGRVLDLACGDGWFTGYLYESLSDPDLIVGVDEDPRELAEAWDSLDVDRVRFELGDVRDLRFQAECFDLVAISNALHHIPKPWVALAEAERVLDNRGTLVVHEMTRETDSQRQQNAREFHHLKAEVDRLLGIPHRETLSKTEIHDLLSTAGLVTIQETTYHPDPQDDPEAIDARIEFLRGYIQHASGFNEFASIRKRATMLAERIRIHGFAPAPQLLVAAEKH